MDKICHFTSSHSLDDSRIAHKELKTLKAHYDDVYLVTHANDKALVELERLHYIKTDKYPSRHRFQRLIFDPWYIYKKAISVNADIYHFHDPELLPYAVLLRLKGKKVIYDAHEDLNRDIQSKKWIPFWARKVLGKLADWFEKLLSKSCHLVITSCNPISNKFLAHGQHAITINNYPDDTVFYPMNIQKKNQVCYIGTITKTRGIKNTIKACYLANVKLVLAGHFRDQQLYDECIKMKEWACVDWRGYLAHEAINKLMNESLAGILLLTYSQHYQPIKLYEYLSAGLPVIASNFKSWVNLIEKNGLGFCVNPNNIDDIVKAISSISNDRLSHEMGAKARKVIKAKYTWQTQSVKLLQAYRRLTGHERDINENCKSS